MQHGKETVTIAAIAIAMFGLTGCSAADNASAEGTKSATNAQETLGLGAPFTVKQSGGTAKITIESATYGATVDGPLASDPKNGGFLILDVLWETADGTSSANPMYFNAKTTDGHAGKMEIFADGLLTSGEVPAGDQSRGKIIFDIGPGPYTVTVTDQALQEKARLTIDASPR